MKTVRVARWRAVVAAGAVVAAAGCALAQSGEVNVYTYRESKLIQPLFDAFTKDTGIKVNVISASSGLEQRIKTEGANSPADVLLTVDIGRLEDAVQAGITQPIKSDLLDKAVPAQFRDPEGHWYGVSMRARVVYASKARVPARAPSPTKSSPTRNGRARSASAPASTSTTTRCSPPSSPSTARPRPRNGSRASRPTWRRSLRAATARPRATSPPANATSASATPITGR